MKKTLNYVLSLGILLLIGLGQTGCGPKKDAKEGSQKMIVAISADNPPYTFYDTSTGRRDLRGFEIDLATLVAQELGVTLEFRDMDFGALIASIQAGRADLIMALLAPTEERREKVDFSEIYSRSSPAFLLKHPHPRATVETAGAVSLKESDLTGMRIGVQIASSHLELIKEISDRVEGIEFVVLNRVGDLVQELKSDRLEGILVEETVADSFLKNNPGLHKALLAGHAIKAAAAFPKKSPWLKKFNQALKALSDRGDLEKLVLKWTPSQ